MMGAQGNANRSNLRKVMRNIPFFSGLSEEEFHGLESITVERRFSKNQVILLEEDSSRYLYVVYTGKVKAVQTLADGREHILAVRGRGDFFGEMGILDGKTAPATVIAMEDTYIGLIAKEEFDRYLLTNNRFLRQMILVLCSRLRESWFKLKVLTFPEAEYRVRAVLKLISEQFGVKDSRGIAISFKLTHRDIAKHVSLARETVTRQMDKLFKAGEIEVLENRHILLKPLFFEKSLLW